MSKEKHMEKTFIMNMDIIDFYCEAMQRLGPLGTEKVLLGLAKAHSIICLGASIETTIQSLTQMVCRTKKVLEASYDQEEAMHPYRDEDSDYV